MQTDDLIRAISADATQGRPLAVSLRLAIAVGGGLTVVMFLAALGIRPDAVQSMDNPRFLFKFLVTLALAAAAARLVLQLSRPGAATQPWLLLVAPAMLGAAVVFELAVVPSAQWVPTMFGTTWRACLVAIPALSLPILGALLVALRRGAPSSPAVTGAVAGLLAGGLGAALYATHCPGDSPLFLGAWYTLALAETALAGSILGARLLRW